MTPAGVAIDAALARRLVDSQFPQWAELAIEPVEVDGWDNRTFRLGEELTLRLPSGEWYAKQVAKEQRWLPELAPRLPLPIPRPVAQGAPDDGFPYPWSVYRWLDGELAGRARIDDLERFASDLAGFLNALGRVDATDGPPPGEHNWFRGAHVTVYEQETFDALDALGDEVDRAGAERVWALARATAWDRAPVWFHGDVAVNNLLVRDGRLAGVLDFGSSGVGDPACDVVIAWTFFDDPARERFRAELAWDADTWARGRGWALWKALITLRGRLENGEPGVEELRAEIARILARP